MLLLFIILYGSESNLKKSQGLLEKADKIMASNRMTAKTLQLKSVLSKHVTSSRYISLSNKLYTTKEKLSDGEGKQFDIDNIEDMAKAVKCTPLEQFREDVKPFMKELFVGNLWKKSFAYPDILTNDRYFHVNKKVNEIKESLAEKKHLIDQFPKTYYSR